MEWNFLRLLDPVQYNLHQLLVRSQGIAQHDPHSWVSLLRISTEFLQVFRDMPPHREKIGNHANLRRARFGTAAQTRWDVWLDKFQVGDFHQIGCPPLPNRVGQPEQIRVRLVASGTMRNQ